MHASNSSCSLELLAYYNNYWKVFCVCVSLLLKCRFVYDRTHICTLNCHLLFLVNIFGHTPSPWYPKRGSQAPEQSRPVFFFRLLGDRSRLHVRHQLISSGRCILLRALFQLVRLLVGLASHLFGILSKKSVLQSHHDLRCEEYCFRHFWQYLWSVVFQSDLVQLCVDSFRTFRRLVWHDLLLTHNSITSFSPLGGTTKER